MPRIELTPEVSDDFYRGVLAGTLRFAWAQLIDFIMICVTFRAAGLSRIYTC